MARATWLLGATSLVGVSLSLWLYLENRSLRSELSAHAAPAPAPTAQLAARAAPPSSSASGPSRTVTPVAHAPAAEPALPEAPKETRMDRRARRTEEFAAQFGRLDGETEDEYRSRILPLLSAGLAVPRLRVEEMRRTAQDKAHVTPEQSAKLDKAFEKIYSDVIDYTNKAVADGQVQVIFPPVWAEFDDRCDAREIIDENIKKIEHKRDLRVQVMENGSHVDGPYFDSKLCRGEDLNFHYVVTNTNEGHNLLTASLGAQPHVEPWPQQAEARIAGRAEGWTPSRSTRAFASVRYRSCVPAPASSTSWAENAAASSARSVSRSMLSAIGNRTWFSFAM